MRPITRARALTAAIALAVLACTPSATPSSASSAPTASAGEQTRGTLLIVGGGSQPDTLVTEFIRLAGGAGRATIAVVPMASGEAEESGRDKAQQLVDGGARAFVLLVDRAQAEGDSTVHLLDSVTGVWFTGGDQARLTPILSGTPLLAAMKARYRAGAVIGGTSAGAAIMTDSMLTGNQFRDGVDTAGYFGDEFPSIARRSIEVVPGLGFLSGAIVDQHFVRRERANRLLSVVLERPSLIGVGIDEGTAVIVRPDGTWDVLGRSAALIFDARRATVSSVGAPLLGASEVRLHVVPSGGRFDPRSGEASLPAR
jgi:cyanophycinase